MTLKAFLIRISMIFYVSVTNECHPNDLAWSGINGNTMNSMKVYDALFYHTVSMSFLWRHNGRDSVSNHQPHDCLLNRLFRRRAKKTSKLRVTGLCAGNSTGAGEFPAQMASNAENFSIWWRHYGNKKGRKQACQKKAIQWHWKLLV